MKKPKKKRLPEPIGRSRPRPSARAGKPSYPTVNTVDDLIGKLETGPPIVATKPEKPGLQCSFCGKSSKEVKKLIAGPTVYICDECVVLCRDICAEDGVVIPPVPVDEEKAKADREAKAEKAKAERIAKASEVVTLLTEGKSVTAQQRIRELAGLVGDDSFTKTEVRDLVAFCAAANEQHLDLSGYAERLKNQLALWERAKPAGAWPDGMLGLLGGGLLAGAAMSYLAYKGKK